MHTYKLTKFVFATAMLSSVILASGTMVSEAADVPRAPAYPAPPPPLLFYIWTGLYIGAHAGGGWADFGSDSGTFITGNSVTLQTLKLGVNYRFGEWPF